MKGRKPKARKAEAETVAAVPSLVVLPSQPPATLPAEAITIWQAAVDDLGQLLQPAHLPLVEMLAVSVARHRQAQAVIDSEGIIVDDGHGPKTHPAVRIERDSAMLCLRLAEQLGLSPSARVRLGLMQVMGQSLLQISERLDAELAGPRRAK